MIDDQERLREYGLQENQHVLATIFNSKSPLHSNLEYLEKASKHACVQAQSTFGSTDPVYLDAKINAALFYWYRVKKYELANDHLRAATATVKNLPNITSELLAKLLCTLALNERRRLSLNNFDAIRGILTETFPEPFGHSVEHGEFTSAIVIFRSMSEVAEKSSDTILPYLIWKIGLPFSYELYACGHISEAIQVLRNEVLTNAVQVWGEESSQVKRVTSEAHWLKTMRSEVPQISHDLVNRTCRDLQTTFQGTPLPQDLGKTPRVLELFNHVQSSINEIMTAALDNITEPLKKCEENIQTLLYEMQDEGYYSDILNWTNSFLSTAAEQINSDMEQHGFSDGLSADERDLVSSSKEGDAVQVPMKVCHPGQEYISREHLSWYLYHCGSSRRSGAIVVSILIPALDALACLYDISPDFKKKQKSLEIRKLVLRLAHANCSDPDLVSRMRVKLAQSLIDHSCGDWDDTLRCVLVHTDNLEFSDHSDPYYAALGCGLRAAALWMRPVVQNLTLPRTSKSNNPVMDSSDPLIDMILAEDTAKRAFSFFDESCYPIEYAQLMHSKYDGLLAKVTWDNTTHDTTKVCDSDAGNKEDETTDDEVDTCLHHLAFADLVLDPFQFTERWVDIQILRARILDRTARIRTNLLDDPWEVLLRSKAFISHLDPSILHLRVNTALASLGAMKIETLRAGFHLESNGAYPCSGRYDIHAFIELSMYGESLFEQGKFEEVVALFDYALGFGERLFERGRSLKSLRIIAHHMGQVARQLAYCYHRAGEYTKAVITLERGKARLLLASIESELIDWQLVPEATRYEAERLFQERRQLIAQSDSSIAFIEDIDRLTELQTELTTLLPSEVSKLRSQDLTIDYLSDIPPRSIIALPLITEYESAVYLIRSTSDKLCDDDVVQLPDFTSDTLNGWLVGGEAPGWLEVYNNRNRSRLDSNRFQNKLEEISILSFRHLMGPICDRVRAKRLSDIIFVPSSGLQMLPLHCSGPYTPEASWDRQTTLLDEFSFRTVPSATVFQVLQQRSGASAEKWGLVAGISDYDDPGWGTLPNAKVEASMVAGEIGVRPVLDDDVTPELLSCGVRGSKYLHIACHGSNWATDPMFFTGFSSKAILILKKGGLSTREILSSWNLEGTRLVCLSACDTGLIDLFKPWDEFEGISNVMLHLGVQKLIASLWSVDDKSTALLMAMVYRNIVSNKMSAEEALRQAQNWLRSATLTEIQTKFPLLYNEDKEQEPEFGDSLPFSHPYFWASFVMTG